MSIDVALSYAGEDDGVAVEVASGLRNAGLEVFRYKDSPLVDGPDVSERLQRLYASECRSVVLLISRHYIGPDRSIPRTEMLASLASGRPVVLALLDSMSLPKPLVQGSQETGLVEYYDLRRNSRSPLHIAGFVDYVVRRTAIRLGEPTTQSGRFRVLMVSPEYLGYAVHGGLGVAVAGLAESLATQGHDVRVLVPSLTEEASESLDPLPSEADMADALCVRARRIRHVTMNWIENHTTSVSYGYGYGQGDRPVRSFHQAVQRYLVPDEIASAWWVRGQTERVMNYCRLVADIIARLALSSESRPDIIQLHDWTTAFAARTIRLELERRGLGRIPIVLTVHNGSHIGIDPKMLEQGRGWLSRCVMSLFGRSKSLLTFPDASYGSLLEAGIAEADATTTVSPTYAVQLAGAHPDVDETISARAANRGVVGILNGVRYEDLAIGDPDGQDSIVPPDEDAFWAWKRRIRAAVLTKLGGPVRPDDMLVVYLHRLVEQKGIVELLEARKQLAQIYGVFIVVAGQPGNKAIRRSVERLGGNLKGLAHWLDFDERNRLLAAADAILMPSRFEPCGLTHLEGMHFGAVPIVSERDGFLDSVVEYRKDGGFGIWVSDTTAAGIASAVSEARRLFLNRPLWATMARNARSCDHSWARPGGPTTQYLALFSGLVGRRKADVDRADPTAGFDPTGPGTA